MRGSSITLEDYPLEQALDIFRDAGFDVIEMWRHDLKRCKTDELRMKFAAYARGKGISMGGLNAVGEDYYQPFGTDQQLEQTLEGLKADADFALSLGTKNVLIWEGRAPQGTTESHWMKSAPPTIDRASPRRDRCSEVKGCSIPGGTSPFHCRHERPISD